MTGSGSRSRRANIPGIVKTTLDGFDQRAYLEGKTETSARDHFFYYAGPTPSAVRYKNWKLYYTMVGSSGLSSLAGAQTFGWTQLTNLKRDPFEQAVGGVGEDVKAVLATGGVLAAPSTAYLYNWNVLPVGQLLWLKELESWARVPPLQDPASYNLSSVLEQVEEEDGEQASEPVIGGWVECGAREWSGGASGRGARFLISRRRRPAPGAGWG